MKIFYAFVKKEFIHILRDSRSLAIVIAMPVILILLFGFAITNDIKKSPVGVLDFSRDSLSSKIAQRINASEYFEIVKDIKSFDEADRLLKICEVKSVIVFPPDFRRNITKDGKFEILCDASDPNEATSISSYLKAIANLEIADEIGNNSVPIPEICAKFLYNPQLKSAYYFVPGVICVVLFLICSLLTSVGIVGERERGSMEILLVSPMRSWVIIAAKVAPYIAISVVILTEILLIVRFIVNVPIGENIILLYAVCLLFTALSLSLGIMVSTIANSTQTAVFLVMGILILPTILLSGMVFPIENMPIPLQIISNIVPATWMNVALKNIMLKNAGFADVIQSVVIIASITLFFGVVSVARFKTKL